MEDLEQVNLRGARVMAQKVVPREVCGGDSERQMECIHPAEKSTDHAWNRPQRGSKCTAGEGRSIQPAEGNEYKYESADLRPRRKIARFAMAKKGRLQDGGRQRFLGDFTG